MRVLRVGGLVKQLPAKSHNFGKIILRFPAGESPVLLSNAGLYHKPPPPYVVSFPQLF